MTPRDVPVPATAALHAVDAPRVARVALLSVHTSPLDAPGTGDGGGLNVYVLEVARRLAGRGVHVDVFTRRTVADQPDTVRVAPGLDVHHVTAGPVGPVDKADLANLLCAFVLAMERHPSAATHDVIHAHYWLSGWVARRLASRWAIPFVQTFHTLGVLKNATLAPGDRPEPALRLIAEERIARAADRVLVLTCGEARLLHRTYGLSGARLTVVPAGVDLGRFRPDVAGDDAMREADRATAAGRGPMLLFAGRLQPLKGPDVAVRTLAQVRRHVPDAWLRIVGGASGTGVGVTDPERLRALADRLGVGDGVVIEPAVDQERLAELYRRADVLLAPSRSETFGLVALEAQASGTPVVAADVPGLQAVVGEGGTLVPGHDPADHAAAAVRYLHDPALAQRTGRAGISAASRASWDATVDRLEHAYGAVVAARDAAAASATDHASETAELAG
ncbi:MAG: glycosyltransferase [Nitriliruptoraceae bacterium]|nr:glycosyltransferase [Nitriliruptoraceae bacterium]